MTTKPSTRALSLSYLVLFAAANAVRAVGQSNRDSDNLYPSSFMVGRSSHRQLQGLKSDAKTIYTTNNQEERPDVYDAAVHTLAYELRAKRRNGKGGKGKSRRSRKKGMGMARSSKGRNPQGTSSKGTSSKGLSSKGSGSKGRRGKGMGIEEATLSPVPSQAPTVSPLLQPTEAPSGSPSSMPSSPPAIILYQNDFEDPEDLDVGNLNCDLLGPFDVNTHYGRETNMFRQDNTVEPFFLNSTGLLYGDMEAYVNTEPERTGNFGIGMLSEIEDDKLGLEFDSEGLRYINVRMDFSSIDFFACGCGPLGIEIPIYRVSAIDASNGPPSLSATPLDFADMIGEAAPNEWTFSWVSRSVALDVGAAINGQITIVWDLIQSPYAVFDNLVITASDDPNTFGGM